jgi:hypothetical protein
MNNVGKFTADPIEITFLHPNKSDPILTHQLLSCWSQIRVTNYHNQMIHFGSEASVLYQSSTVALCFAAFEEEVKAYKNIIIIINR